jgi:hypothetical protein
LANVFHREKFLTSGEEKSQGKKPGLGKEKKLSPKKLRGWRG